MFRSGFIFSPMDILIPSPFVDPPSLLLVLPPGYRRAGEFRRPCADASWLGGQEWPLLLLTWPPLAPSGSLVLPLY